MSPVISLTLISTEPVQLITTFHSNISAARIYLQPVAHNQGCGAGTRISGHGCSSESRPFFRPRPRSCFLYKGSSSYSSCSENF